MSTIDDVAREAGVGIGTVSRVLNNSPLVSAQLRQRVLAAIERLDYHPSRAARAFGRRRTHALELLVPLFIGSFFLELLRGIEEALAGTDYTLLARTIAQPEDRERALDECCTRGRADGALVLWTLPTERFIARLAAEPFAVVLLNVIDPRFWSVAVDHDAAAQHAVEYCMRLGHRRIALVDRHQDVFDQASVGICGRGYRAALRGAGVNPPDGYERMAELGQAGGANALDAFFALPEPPTAVIAASDDQAVGAFLAARERGLQVPRDLSIVGYSDSPYIQYLGLTTIDIKVHELGREATRALLGAITDPTAAPRTIYRPTELLVRRTCGAPPAK
jgi:DNA-binding LacI/PurR family transcriptional regulator